MRVVSTWITGYAITSGNIVEAFQSGRWP
jgi:hypothetical protein